MCHDTPGWKTKNDLRCSTFAQRYCENGDIKPKLFKYASSIYNNPAENCCECGKRIAEEISRPAVPVNPNTIYNKCTTKEEDKDNYRMIEYCSSIGSDYKSCNSDNGEYCQQKCGKSHEKIQIVLPENTEELQLAIQADQGTQIIDLGKKFNSITQIEPKGTECGIGGVQVFHDKSGLAPLNGRRLQ